MSIVSVELAEEKLKLFETDAVIKEKTIEKFK